MIAREELELLTHGATGQAAHAVESVSGTRLTRSELDALAAVLARFGAMVVSACALARVPPPQPAPRPLGRAQPFRPALTQELPRVSDEDIERARKK